MHAEHVGQLIKRKRETLDWTQAQLAARAGVAPRTVLRIEGGAPVRPSSIADVAKALKITPETLENYGEDAAADLLRRRTDIEELAEGPAASAQLVARITDLAAQAPLLGYDVEMGQRSDGSHWVNFKPSGDRRPLEEQAEHRGTNRG